MKINLQTHFETLNYRHELTLRKKTISKIKLLKVYINDIPPFYLSSIPNFHELNIEEIDFKLKLFLKNVDLNFENLNFQKKYFNLIKESENYLTSTISGEELFQIESLLIHILKSKNLLPQMKQLKINDLFHPGKSLNEYAHSLCLKIKTNPENCLESINIMNQLREINPQILFRLDGNQKFTLEELVAFTKNILCHSKIKNAIDYIEEPLLTFYDSICYIKRSPFLLAVDESAICLLKSDSGKNNFLQSPFVFKPSFIGISPLYQWMTQHKQSRVIISSSYDHLSNHDGLNLLGNLRIDEYHGLSDVF